LIVHWPEGVPKTNNEKLVSEYDFLPDLMTTFCEVSNTKYPSKFKGNDIPLSAGKSLVLLFVGKKEQIHQEAIFWEHEGNKAVRLGNYKLVSQWSNEIETIWELYDMEIDRTDTHNLASKMPDMVKKLRKEYNDWASKNHVLAYSDIKKLSGKKGKNKSEPDDD
jgi:arylsulfatase